MNKIEEILCSTFDVEFENFYDEYGIASALEYKYHRTYDPHKIFKAIKEYAEYYAKKMQDKLIEQCWIDDYGQILIDEATIKNIKLPEHE